MQYIWLFDLNEQTKTLSTVITKINKLFVSGQLTKYEKVLKSLQSFGISDKRGTC